MKFFSSLWTFSLYHFTSSVSVESKISYSEEHDDEEEEDDDSDDDDDDEDDVDDDAGAPQVDEKVLKLKAQLQSIRDSSSDEEEEEEESG